METGAGESRRPKHRVPDRSPGTRGGLVGLRLRRGLYKFGRPTNNFFASRPTPRAPPDPGGLDRLVCSGRWSEEPDLRVSWAGLLRVRGRGQGHGRQPASPFPVCAPPRILEWRRSGPGTLDAETKKVGNVQAWCRYGVGCSVRRGTSHKHTGGSRISEFSVSSSPHGTRLMESANPRCASRARVIGHRER